MKQMRSTLDNFSKEFETIRILIKSDTKTGRTDAFIVAWTKMEKQIRKVFSFLVYQYPCFSPKNRANIKKSISENYRLNYNKFINGFDRLYHTDFNSIIGKRGEKLRNGLEQIRRDRNKIIHGQLTGKDLTRDELIERVRKIEEYMKIVGKTMGKEIGYDGLEKNALRKSPKKNLPNSYKTQINNIKDFKQFLTRISNSRS